MLRCNEVADLAGPDGLAPLFENCSVDKVGDLHVFDIGGNKFRLIVFLQFAQQIAYIKHVLTHAEYDRNHWRQAP